MPLIPGTSDKPRVILGLMTFGPPGGESTGARVTDLGEYNAVLDKLQSRGYNEVDTARMYVGGQQEAHSREARWKDRGLTLATKVRYPAEPGANTPEKVLESVEISLKDLGTDCVDVSACRRVTELPMSLPISGGYSHINETPMVIFKSKD